MKVSVSFLKSLDSKEETIKKIDSSSADYIHVDIMDGIFVKEKNDDLDELISLLKKVNKPLDIHLMVLNPQKYIEKLKVLKPEFITIQVEILNPLVYLKLIKSYNIKAGLAINPDTKVKMILPYLNYIDLVLVMSVYPGKGGQKFITSVDNKLKEIPNNKVLISIDGGINDETIKNVRSYIDMCVSGSYVCMNENFDEQIKKLR